MLFYSVNSTNVSHPVYQLSNTIFSKKTFFPPEKRTRLVLCWFRKAIFCPSCVSESYSILHQNEKKIAAESPTVKQYHQPSQKWESALKNFLKCLELTHAPFYGVNSTIVSHPSSVPFIYFTSMRHMSSTIFTFLSKKTFFPPEKRTRLVSWIPHVDY